jgi:hypothetical protein
MPSNTNLAALSDSDDDEVVPSAQELESMYVTPARIQQNKQLQADDDGDVEVEIVEDAEFEILDDEDFEILDEDGEAMEDTAEIDMGLLSAPSAQTMTAATSVDALADEASSMFALMSRRATVDRHAHMEPEPEESASAASNQRQVGRVAIPDLHGRDEGPHLNDVGRLEIPSLFH